MCAVIPVPGFTGMRRRLLSSSGLERISKWECVWIRNAVRDECHHGVVGVEGEELTYTPNVCRILDKRMLKY